jgi:hypothetical protein
MTFVPADGVAVAIARALSFREQLGRRSRDL